MGSAGDRDWLSPFDNIQILCFRTVYREFAKVGHRTAASTCLLVDFTPEHIHFHQPSQQCQRVHPSSTLEPSCGQACSVLWSLWSLGSLWSLWLPRVSFRLQESCFLERLSVCAPLPCPEDTQVYICLQAAATWQCVLSGGLW